MNPEDADGLIKFMEEYLNYVYVMPAKVAQKREKKQKKAEGQENASEKQVSVK